MMIMFTTLIGRTVPNLTQPDSARDTACISHQRRCHVSVRDCTRHP
jgi:hypothetical protein